MKLKAELLYSIMHFSILSSNPHCLFKEVPVSIKYIQRWFCNSFHVS